jgi:hypothetical protein
MNPQQILFRELHLDILLLVIGILAVMVGLASTYASAHDKVNALGRYTGLATVFVILGGILLIALAFFY